MQDLIATSNVPAHDDGAWELVMQMNGEVTGSVGIGAAIEKEIAFLERALRLQNEGAEVTLALAINGQELKNYEPELLLRHALELDPGGPKVSKLFAVGDSHLAARSSSYCYSEYQYCLADCRKLPVAERIGCRIDCSGEYDDCVTSGGGGQTNDSDGDGILDPNDNCVVTANPGQEDCDGDGQGDVCDATVSDFVRLNSLDVCSIIGYSGTNGSLSIYRAADFSSGCFPLNCRSAYLAEIATCSGKTAKECCEFTLGFGYPICVNLTPPATSVSLCQQTCS